MPIRLRPLRNRDAGYAGVSGVARVDRRTKNLTKRLRPGDIAIIDHIDLDKVSAEALVACRPAAVINAAPSISGRYPNLGPEILVAAGIPLVDGLGTDVMIIVKIIVTIIGRAGPPWPGARPASGPASTGGGSRRGRWRRRWRR